MRVYSKPEVAAELRRLAARSGVGHKNLSAELRRAVFVHWGSLARARRSLGLRRPVSGARQWSRQRVIDEIVKLQRAGQHLSYRDVIKAGRNDLIVAAQRYAGGWRRARELAGIDFKSRIVVGLPKWDANSVITEILDRYRRGAPLAPSKAPSALTSAGIRVFGSWREAVTAAGINYGKIATPRKHDDEVVLDWLRSLARKQPQMTLRELQDHGGHAVVARRRWGSLEAAARAAGITRWPLRVRNRALSRDALLRAIQRLDAQGHALTMYSMRTTPRGYFLLNSATHHFPTWGHAVRAAKRNDSGPRSRPRSRARSRSGLG